MKTIISILTSTFTLALISNNSNASLPEDLLKYENTKYEIQSANNKDVKGISNTGVKTINGTVYTEITNVCIEDDVLNTINKVISCSKWVYKPLSRSQCNNDGKRFPCFDNNERVCLEYEKVSGSHPMNYEISKCASLMDPESRSWRNQAGNNSENFKTNYPECSVFKKIAVKKTTKFNFNIVSPNFNPHGNGLRGGSSSSKFGINASGLRGGSNSGQKLKSLQRYVGNYDNQLGGYLIERLSYELPQCSEL
jgi:hypothetical protein